MTRTIAEHQLLLLDILSPIREVPQSAIAQLDEHDWAQIMRMSEEHRVTPLLDWRLKHEKAHLMIPENVRLDCADSFKAATKRSLAIQRELLLLHRLLKEGGFQHIFLKGAYLAYFAYPQPGLRPMRDVDILIPEQEIIKAFNFLLDHGVDRIDKYQSIPHPSNVSLVHQLPPIYSPSKTTCLELHSSLFHIDERSQTPIDPSKDQSFWDRSIQRNVGNETLNFQSPEDLLLHLIEHAVYGHKFNNGPLLLSDISYLLETHEMDWPKFWRLTEDVRCTRGARLTLELFQRYYGKGAIGWPAGQIQNEAISESVINSSAMLLLRDFRTSCETNIIITAKTRTDISSVFSFIKKRVFPSRPQLALLYPISPTSPLIYFYYPLNWWRLLAERIPNFLRVTQKQNVSEDMRQLSIVNQWLNSQGTSSVVVAPVKPTNN